MESASTTTSSNLFDSHPLPHQQFSSRIAFANNSRSVKLKLNKASNKKSTRLPPIARYDSFCSPPISAEGIRYFNRSADSSHSFDDIETNSGLDPNLRIKQMERNMKFVKEDCHHLLESLHQELEDLKNKNRDLQFQLITNSSFSPQLTQPLSKEQFVLMPLIRGALEPQIGEFITKLENEVKRLRIALGETLKANALLKQELQDHKPLTSPTVRDFNKTFEEINKIYDLNAMENTINLPRIANTVSK